MSHFYVCPVRGCGNRFMGNRRFLEHKRTHDEEYVKKNLLCECGRRFTTRGNLSAHRRRWCIYNNSKPNTVKILNVENLSSNVQPQDAMDQTEVCTLEITRCTDVNGDVDEVDICASNNDLFLEYEHQDHYLKLTNDNVKSVPDEKLQNDHLQLQIQHKELQDEHQKLQLEFEKLKNDHLELQVEYEKLQNNHWKYQIERQVIQVVQFETFDEGQELQDVKLDLRNDCHGEEDVQLLVDFMDKDAICENESTIVEEI